MWQPGWLSPILARSGPRERTSHPSLCIGISGCFEGEPLSAPLSLPSKRGRFRKNVVYTRTSDTDTPLYRFIITVFFPPPVAYSKSRTRTQFCVRAPRAQGVGPVPRTVWRHHLAARPAACRAEAAASAGLLCLQLQPSTPGRQTPGGRWPMPASTTLCTVRVGHMCSYSSTGSECCPFEQTTVLLCTRLSLCTGVK